MYELILGDCIDILRTMPDKSVDCIVTDPPYIISAKGCALAGDRQYLHDIADAHINAGFSTGLGDLVRERFEQGFRNFQLGMADEVDRTARAIYEELEKKLYHSKDFLFLGRGVHFPIALEGALKLKEISYIHAEGYPAGEMKHGPNALIDENLPVVVLATRDPDSEESRLRYEKTLSNIQEVKARSGIVIAVVCEGDVHEVCKIADYLIPIPHTTEFLLPILEIVPLQLLAYHIAVRLGCDVDQPRNLAKSVTVE